MGCPLYRRRRGKGQARGRGAVAILLMGILGSWVAGADQQKVVFVERDPAALPIGYQRYFTQDSLGRKITFYLSHPPTAKPRRPLAVFILGSGCQSLFYKREEVVYGSLQNILLDAANGRTRVLVVEKPGVRYLDRPERPGVAEGCPREFLEEHTLPRWAEAVGAAVRAAHTLPDIDSTKTLVMGHSEGGIVAARVAAENPTITHVASLAGVDLHSYLTLPKWRAAEALVSPRRRPTCGCAQFTKTGTRCSPTRTA